MMVTREERIEQLQKRPKKVSLDCYGRLRPD